MLADHPDTTGVTLGDTPVQTTKAMKVVGATCEGNDMVFVFCNHRHHHHHHHHHHHSSPACEATVDGILMTVDKKRSMILIMKKRKSGSSK
jgi:hypothetical protein